MFRFAFLFKALQIAGIVTTWAAAALEDNKVTLIEAAQLAESIASVLGIKTELEIPIQEQEE